MSNDPQPLSSNPQQSAEEVLRSYGFYLSHSSDDAIDAMEEYATLRCQALEEEIGKHMENNAAMSNQVLSLTAHNQQMREAMQRFVARCDAGQARSQLNYNEFKNILNQP
jgi:hypothetical protein